MRNSITLFLSIVAPALGAAIAASAAGPRNHMWSVNQALDRHIASTANAVPGLVDLFESKSARRALYLGSTFPDWGYQMGAGRAAETAHWSNFQYAYLRHLVREIPRDGEWSRWDKARIAFFMGLVSHGLVDTPWHFSSERHRSLLRAAQENDGADHTDTETSMEIVSFRDLDLDAPIWFYQWPKSDLVSVYDSLGMDVSGTRLKLSTIKMNAGWYGAKIAAPFAAQRYRFKFPWLSEGYKDYYFGGLRHGGAASAIAMREIYATLRGGFCLQQGPDWGAAHRAAFAVYRGCETASIFEGLPENNSGSEPWIASGNSKKSGRAAALIRFDLSRIPTEFMPSRAKLMVCLEVTDETPPDDSILRLLPLSESWQCGVGKSDSVDGILGVSTDRGGVTGQDWKRLLPHGMTNLATTASKPHSQAARVALPNLDCVWIEWDVSEDIRDQLRNPSGNNGWAILTEQTGNSPKRLHRILSSNAWKNEPEGMAGGTRIAYRPLLILWR